MVAVTRLRYVAHPGSLIFMISDFRNMSEKAFAQVANISRNNDIIMVKISDPIEADLPASGSYRLTDGSNELQIETSSKQSRDEYRRRFSDRQQQIVDFCRKHRIHLINISTDDNLLDQLKTSLGINTQGKKTHYRGTQRSS